MGNWVKNMFPLCKKLSISLVFLATSLGTLGFVHAEFEGTIEDARTNLGTFLKSHFTKDRDHKTVVITVKKNGELGFTDAKGNIVAPELSPKDLEFLKERLSSSRAGDTLTYHSFTGDDEKPMYVHQRKGYGFLTTGLQIKEDADDKPYLESYDLEQDSELYTHTTIAPKLFGIEPSPATPEEESDDEDDEVVEEDEDKPSYLQEKFDADEDKEKRCESRNDDGAIARRYDVDEIDETGKKYRVSEIKKNGKEPVYSIVGVEKEGKSGEFEEISGELIIDGDGKPFVKIHEREAIGAFEITGSGEECVSGTGDFISKTLTALGDKGVLVEDSNDKGGLCAGDLERDKNKAEGDKLVSDINESLKGIDIKDLPEGDARKEYSKVMKDFLKEKKDGYSDEQIKALQGLADSNGRMLKAYEDLDGVKETLGENAEAIAMFEAMKDSTDKGAEALTEAVQKAKDGLIADDFKKGWSTDIKPPTDPSLMDLDKYAGDVVSDLEGDVKLLKKKAEEEKKKLKSLREGLGIRETLNEE